MQRITIPIPLDIITISSVLLRWNTFFRACFALFTVGLFDKLMYGIIFRPVVGTLRCAG